MTPNWFTFILFCGLLCIVQQVCGDSEIADTYGVNVEHDDRKGFEHRKLWRRDGPEDCKPTDKFKKANYLAFEPRNELRILERDAQIMRVFDAIYKCFQYLVQPKSGWTAETGMNKVLEIDAEWPAGALFCMLEISGIVPTKDEVKDEWNPKKNLGSPYSGMSMNNFQQCLLHYHDDSATNNIEELYNETPAQRKDRWACEQRRFSTLKSCKVDRDNEIRKQNDAKVGGMDTYYKEKPDFSIDEFLEKQVAGNEAKKGPLKTLQAKGIAFKRDIVQWRKDYMAYIKLNKMMYIQKMQEDKFRDLSDQQFWQLFGSASSEEIYNCFIAPGTGSSEFMASFMDGPWRRSINPSSEAMDPATAWLILLNLDTCKEESKLAFLGKDPVVTKDHDWQALDIPDYVGKCWQEFLGGNSLTRFFKSKIKTPIRRLMVEDYDDKKENEQRNKWMYCMMPQQKEGELWGITQSIITGTRILDDMVQNARNFDLDSIL